MGLPIEAARMPTIPPSVPPPSLPANGPPYDLFEEWNLLGPELKARVSQLLDLEDLGSLSRASCVAGNAISAGTLDGACRKWFEQAETGAIRPPPELKVERFDGRALSDAGFPHAAALLNLARMRAHWEDIPTTPASHVSVRIPGLKEYGLYGCTRMPSGAPLFIGEIAGDGADAVRIVFATGAGELEATDCLRGARLVYGDCTGHLPIQGPMPPGRDVELVVRCADGRLAVYCPASGVLERLPDVFTDPENRVRPDADLSTNGRYVAAQIEETLLVYDRIGRRVVVDGDVGSDVRGLTVDSQGTLFVAEHPWPQDWINPALVDAVPDGHSMGLAFDREQGWHALPGTHGIHRHLFALCPNERYLLTGREGGFVLVDREALESSGIVLESHPGSREKVDSNAVAFSAGYVVLAIAFADNSIRLFDLAEPDPGPDPVLQPKRILDLPDNARDMFPSLQFSADGSRLDVVYRLWDRVVEFASYDLVDPDPTNGGLRAPEDPA